MELGPKKNVYRKWKQGQKTQEECRDTACMQWGLSLVTPALRWLRAAAAKPPGVGKVFTQGWGLES